MRAGGHNLVVKRITRHEGLRRPALSPADWQVIRSCPVPLMLTRGRSWRPLPRFVASLEATGPTSGGAPSEVLDVARYLADGCQGALEVVQDESAQPGTRTDAALAAIPAPSDIDVVVLRACNRVPAEAGDDAGATLAEQIVITLDCDVLVMPPVVRAR